MNSVGGEIVITIFGIFVIYTWWGETYSDSREAYLGQINPQWGMSRSMAAMTYPCMGIASTLIGISMLLKRAGTPGFVWFPLSFIALFFLFIGFAYVLPFPLPRFADSRYQFMKRNGLLDDNGNPLPDEEVERILAQREENE